jgi:hypothetical protein
MRRPSKFVLRAELDSERTRTHIARTALQLALTKRPDASERVRVDGGCYVLRLYGTKRADGGILVVIWKCPGQSDSIESFLFDDYATLYHPSTSYSSPDSMALACAVGRLAGVR